jgi:hypothetical protein
MGSAADRGRRRARGVDGPGDAAGRGRDATLRRRLRHREPAAGDRSRGCRELHEGLLPGPGGGGPAALSRPSPARSRRAGDRREPAALRLEGQEVGTLGSAVASLRWPDRILGLAVVHRKAGEPGTELEISTGGAATVCPLPWSFDGGNP